MNEFYLTLYYSVQKTNIIGLRLYLLFCDSSFCWIFRNTLFLTAYYTYNIWRNKTKLIFNEGILLENSNSLYWPQCYSSCLKRLQSESLFRNTFYISINIRINIRTLYKNMHINTIMKIILCWTLCLFLSRTYLKKLKPLTTLTLNALLICKLFDIS